MLAAADLLLQRPDAAPTLMADDYRLRHEAVELSFFHLGLGKELFAARAGVTGYQPEKVKAFFEICGQLAVRLGTARAVYLATEALTRTAALLDRTGAPFQLPPPPSSRPRSAERRGERRGRKLAGVGKGDVAANGRAPVAPVRRELDPRVQLAMELNGYVHGAVKYELTKTPGERVPEDLRFGCTLLISGKSCGSAYSAEEDEARKGAAREALRRLHSGELKFPLKT